jgi:hypothetical protein
MRMIRKSIGLFENQYILCGLLAHRCKEGIKKTARRRFFEPTSWIF